MTSRRILILSAASGGGHLRAAQAVEAACRLRHPQAEVLHLDVLTLTSPAFRKLYGDGYLDFVNAAPELLGVLYARTNRPPRNPAREKLKLALDRLNTRPLVKAVTAFRPDVICHTHFLPAGIVAHQKRKGSLTAPHALVITDFEVHRWWLCPGVDRYFVAREDNRVHLEALGEPRDRIRITGIPVDPVFAEQPDVPALRKKHGVSAEVPLLLVLCGGFGVGPVEDLLAALWRSLKRAQLTVITGKNEELRKRLLPLAAQAPIPTKVLGFSREIHEWMAIAELAVSKPGGLTTAEALARGLPLVVTNPIPGQETRNATMLYEEGAAISGENLLTLGARVARLLASPPRVAALRRAARGLGRPQAALEIADELFALAGC